MSELLYVVGGARETLQLGQCYIREGSSERWFMVFSFVRTTDGKTEQRTIPVNPNGDALTTEKGWGLKRIGHDRWQISPSIKCSDRIPDPADLEKDIDVEVWHETPAIAGVPNTEPWTTAVPRS